MNTQSYLIDTNVIIGLEDNQTVHPAYAKLSQLAAKHKVDVFIHEVARDDVKRDKDKKRRDISLSKLEKFQSLQKVKGLNKQALADEFGKISKNNDEVDDTLLHALRIGASDFLVTQDQGLHDRAQKHSADLARRVLFVADAAQLLEVTYEPREVPILHVEDVSAHTISITDTFFDSLREGYPKFDDWWKTKCVGQRRPCWVVYDNDDLVGLVVRKDETDKDTDATKKFTKILKICTFKVRPEQRGKKLGELLLKKILWFAQQNEYDLTYLTAYSEQTSLIALLEYYGFENTAAKDDGELIFERAFSKSRLERVEGESTFYTDRRNYPRFIADVNVRGFVIPIREGYHNVLYPDLRHTRRSAPSSDNDGPKHPGNTIRKVYLCRAQSKLGSPGSILFFYKGKSVDAPSQAVTAVGVMETLNFAYSTKDLMRLTGGRSVYREKDLQDYDATMDNPVKLINYLLVGYVNPPTSVNVLQNQKILKAHPQSIVELKGTRVRDALAQVNFGFTI